MRKYLRGLGSIVVFESLCPEICEYLESYYYLTESAPDGIETVECKIERFGKDYLLTVRDDATTVSHKRIFSYINYSITQLLSETEPESSICFHASGFVYKSKVFLLFNSSGSGKSTLCSYCLSRGGTDIKYLGDDIIKINLSRNKVYGLASAQRLKRGTRELYFADREMYSFDDEGDKIWLYKPDNEMMDSKDISSVNDIIMVNVRYETDSQTIIKKQSAGEALRVLLNNIYNVRNNSRNIIKSLSDMEDAQFFSAVYSNTEKMMSLMLGGFRECSE